MKRRRILFAAVILVVLVSGLLFAAGQKEGTKGPVKLTFWHMWGGSRAELIEKMIANFKAKNPGIEIEATFTAPNDIQKKIVQAAGTGTLPDVFTIGTGWYEELSPADTLLPLDDFLQREKIDLKSILLAPEYARSFYQGKVYSLPNVLAGAQGLFFYNKGSLKKAGLDPVKDIPKNWDDFVRVSKILVDKLNTGNTLEVIAWNPWIHVGQNMIQVFAEGAGSPTVSSDSRNSLFNTPGVIEVAKKFDDYVQHIYGRFGGYRALIEWNAKVLGADVGAAQVAGFITEKQVFYVSGSWTIQQVRSGNASLDFGIAPIPGIKGPQGGFAKNGWSYSMNKRTPNKDAAWKFLKWITIEPAGNGEFCVAQGRPCPIVSVNEDPRLKAQGEIWTSLVNAMKLDLPIVYNDYMAVLMPILNDILPRRVSGENIESIMMSIHKQFQDYLNDLYKKR